MVILKKHIGFPPKKSFLTANWQSLNLTSYQLTKQMSSFSKKLCFVGSCFECKLSKLPFTTMSRPTSETYIHKKPRVFSLACDTSSRYVLQKDSLRKQNAAEPVSTAQRLLTPCSKRNRQFSTEFPWMESRLAMWPPANGKESNHRSRVNNDKKASRGLKLVANIKRYFFPTYNAVCSRE